ncbi:MAG: hypothetical protein H0X29_05620 [Parachlamydiaceae bacterium]|nr:hypothetical protein [Parachlamydiaceae bacterium]
MRLSYFFSKLLLSTFIVPAFFSANADLAESKSSESFFSAKKHHKENVFASYRNDRDITIPAGGNVLFNVENVNKGDGISYHEDGTFSIDKSGFYLINYGLASIGNAGEVGAAYGFNLIKISKDHHTIVDSVLTNASSAIIVHLKEHDRIAIVSQEFLVTLVAGNLPPRTTSLTDTAHITFLRVEHKEKD